LVFVLQILSFYNYYKLTAI